MTITCEQEPAIEAGPEWHQAQRKRAWEAYKACPVPENREAWRFTRLGKVGLEGLRVPEPTEGWAHSPLLEGALAGQLSFVDGHIQEGAGLGEAALKAGVRFMPLSVFLEEESETLRPRWMRMPLSLGSDPYLNLHTAYCAEGAVIWIPKGVCLEAPLVVHQHMLAQQGIVAPRLLVVAEARAQASVLLVQDAQAGSSGLYAHRVDVFADTGAQVRMHTQQALGPEHFVFGWHHHYAKRDARIESVDVHTGGRYSRFENQAYLEEPGSHIQLRSLGLAQGEQQLDQRSLQHHLAPHTSSDLLYKNALWGTARTIFSGMITVAPEAQHTDAYQTNNNLLLSDTAEANALPGLEIEANEVACSHGATTSQVDPEQLFYLRSRGLGPDAARSLIVEGFIADLLQACASPQLQAALTPVLP